MASVFAGYMIDTNSEDSCFWIPTEKGLDLLMSVNMKTFITWNMYVCLWVCRLQVD
jgi:hypothetical protein